MLLVFEGLRRPVALVGCDELTAGLSAVLWGWRFRAPASPPKTPPCITVRRVAKGYGLESLWRESPAVYRDPVDTVCSFIVDLVQAYVADDPSLLCLHCAAAAFAGRLVVFPSRYRAGKSMLSAYLAAAGVRVYADDVLPINRGGRTGIAPGILPRLRLPLPDDADREFRDYVRQRAGLANKRFFYLNLDADELAPRGDEAPIGGFVLLRRAPDARAELTPVRKSEMLKRVVLRNFAYEPGPIEILGRLHDVVGGARCFRLHYSDGGEACALLKETFAAWPSGPQPETRARAAVRPIAPRKDGTPASESIRRTPGIAETPVDDELFLVNPAGETIYHLNVIGAAVWRLLAEPATPDEVVGLLHEAFPDVSKARMERDVRALLSDLAARGLVGDSH